MEKNFLYIAYSSWWLVVLFLFSGLLSYFLYTKKVVPWNKYQNIFLGSIRFFAISCVLFLFLSPTLKTFTNHIEKPVIAFALDNSLSVVKRGVDATQLGQKMDELEAGIKELGLDVKRVMLEDTTAFVGVSTSLSGLIDKTEKRVQNDHFVGMLFATDGIYTSGSSPIYANYLYPIFTLGLGDTIPPKDIGISRSLYNRVSYIGNETPVRLEITQHGYTNKTILVELMEGDKAIKSQTIQLKNAIQEVEFSVKLETEGLKHLTAKITVMPEESTAINNVSSIFMEVIDGRKSVLFVATSPHPDIKSMRTTLDETGNYETEVYIPKIHASKPTKIFDAVIFHGAFVSPLDFEVKGNPGLWYILSNESSLATVNKNLSFLRIERKSSRPDKVVGSYNKNFSKFTTEKSSLFENYPPLEVPFGVYHLSGPVEILMYQKVGSIQTEKPLMTVFDDGTQKIALTMGQNIWCWKLQEAAIHGNTNQFNLLITKTIQFLSVSNDKKQFRFEPRKTNYTNNEPVLFDVEVYNDIYERIYENEIGIEIVGQDNSIHRFDFIDSEYNPSFKSPFLTPGVYRYRASTSIGTMNFMDKGEFVIQSINPEYLTLTANHLLLKNLSKKSGGSYRHFSEAINILDDIAARAFKSKIKSEEKIIPLYQSWWWYLIVFVLFSTEWFLRKYWGGY